MFSSIYLFICSLRAVRALLAHRKQSIGILYTFFFPARVVVAGAAWWAPHLPPPPLSGGEVKAVIHVLRAGRNYSLMEGFRARADWISLSSGGDLRPPRASQAFEAQAAANVGWI